MLAIWTGVLAFPRSLAVDSRIFARSTGNYVDTFRSLGRVGAMPVRKYAVAISISKSAKSFVLYATLRSKKSVEASRRPHMHRA